MKNGDIVKDTITGFTGVVVAEHRYLNGCVRLSVQPKKLKNGMPVEAQTFDIEQIALVKEAAPKVVKPKGGPARYEPSRAVPSR